MTPQKRTPIDKKGLKIMTTQDTKLIREIKEILTRLPEMDKTEIFEKRIKLGWNVSKNARKKPLAKVKASFQSSLYNQLIQEAIHAGDFDLFNQTVVLYADLDEWWESPSHIMCEFKELDGFNIKAPEEKYVPFILHALNSLEGQEMDHWDHWWVGDALNFCIEANLSIKPGVALELRRCSGGFLAELPNIKSALNGTFT